MIFAELKKFVETNFGAPVWPTLLGEAGLASKVYLTVQEYPDTEIVAIVTAASRATGRAAGDLLEEFGGVIVPDLLRLYGGLLDKRWKTLDVIERTENTIHRVVRLRNPGASPPELSCTRPSPHEVIIDYRSERRMCSVAKGIVRGIAAHFGDPITIRELSCMNEGADLCRLSVTTTPPS